MKQHIKQQESIMVVQTNNPEKKMERIFVPARRVQRIPHRPWHLGHRRVDVGRK